MNETEQAIRLANHILNDASRDPDDDLSVLARQLLRTREALFMCAAHCQGSHSTAGQIAAARLGISFPVRISDLEEKAKADGLDPDELWPWLIQLRGQIRRFAGVDQKEG